MVRHDLLDRVLTASIGDAEVEGDDVGLQRRDHLDRLDGTHGLADDRDVAVGLERLHNVRALNERVLDDDDADGSGPVRHARRPSNRSTAASSADSSNALFTM